MPEKRETPDGPSVTHEPLLKVRIEQANLGEYTVPSIVLDCDPIECPAPAADN